MEGLRTRCDRLLADAGAMADALVEPGTDPAAAVKYLRVAVDKIRYLHQAGIKESDKLAEKVKLVSADTEALKKAVAAFNEKISALEKREATLKSQEAILGTREADLRKAEASCSKTDMSLVLEKIKTLNLETRALKDLEISKEKLAQTEARAQRLEDGRSSSLAVISELRGDMQTLREYMKTQKQEFETAVISEARQTFTECLVTLLSDLDIRTKEWKKKLKGAEDLVEKLCNELTEVKARLSRSESRVEDVKKTSEVEASKLRQSLATAQDLATNQSKSLNRSLETMQRELRNAKVTIQVMRDSDSSGSTTAHRRKRPRTSVSLPAQSEQWAMNFEELHECLEMVNISGTCEVSEDDIFEEVTSSTSRKVRRERLKLFLEMGQEGTASPHW